MRRSGHAALARHAALAHQGARASTMPATALAPRASRVSRRRVTMPLRLLRGVAAQAARGESLGLPRRARPASARSADYLLNQLQLDTNEASEL